MRWFLILGLLAGCPGGDDEPVDTEDTDVVDTDVDPVDADNDGSFDDVDCDDHDDTVHPGADELCDGKDNDCDDAVDEDPVDGGTWYGDADRDGWGDDASSTVSCEQPPDTTDKGGDCNDSDDAIHPDANEVCDDADVDEDCDGLADDADDSVDSSTFTRFHADEDGDGFGDPETVLGACDPAAGRVLDDTDCDDSDPEQNPSDGCDPVWAGAWDGTLVADISAPDLGITSTCTLTTGISIDIDRTPAVQNDDTMTCPTAVGDMNVTIKAEFVDDDSIEGEYLFDTYVVPFTADFTSDPDTLQGKGSTTLTVLSYRVIVDHALTASRAD